MNCFPFVISETTPDETNSKPRVVLIPTAAGLMRPLDSAYKAMAKKLTDKGYGTTVIEFPGQNGQKGSYSVFESAKGLAAFLSGYDQDLVLFGICTGALAGLFAANRLTHVKSVICWEMAPVYEYTRPSYERLEKKFGVQVDWETALDELQPIDIISKVNKPMLVTMGIKSKAMTINDLSMLEKQSSWIWTRIIDGLGHIPGLPSKSESKFSDLILDWLNQSGDQRIGDNLMKTFLCSPERGLEVERSIARYCLKSIQQAGGPELVAFEEYLKEKGVRPHAIEEGFENAKNCSCAIVLLKYQPGSPCLQAEANEANEAIGKIKLSVKKKRIDIWKILECKSRTAPPISWVELFILQQNTGINIIAYIDKSTTELAFCYKDIINSSHCIQKRKLKQLFRTYGGHWKQNTYTASGCAKRKDDEIICRLIWLCEFVLWISDNSIPTFGLPEADIIPSRINSFNKGYELAVNSGSFWLERSNAELGKAIAALGRDFEDEVWVYHNDLYFLSNKALFNQTYKSYVKKYNKIKIIISESELEKAKKNGALQKIMDNLGTLENGDKEKITVKTIVNQTLDSGKLDDGYITIWGASKNDLNRAMMVYRPANWGEGGSIEINITIHPSPSGQIVRTMKDKLQSYFEDDEFSPLEEKLKNCTDSASH